MTVACEPQVLPVASLREWFRSSVHAAMARRKVRADPHTEHYIVSLLTAFARSENFYEHHREGFGLRPLAILLADALESRAPAERNALLQRLGDVSLFLAGFFAEGLAHQPVDVDYYSRMGETAYGTLSDLPPHSRHHAALAEVFRELAARFGAFVDVLGEVAQMARVFSRNDILWLYEVWMKTGSPRAAEKLRELGIEPVGPGLSRREH